MKRCYSTMPEPMITNVPSNLSNRQEIDAANCPPTKHRIFAMLFSVLLNSGHSLPLIANLAISSQARIVTHSNCPTACI